MHASDWQLISLCLQPSGDKSLIDGLEEATEGEVDWDIGMEANGHSNDNEDIDWDIDDGDEPQEVCRQDSEAGPSIDPEIAGGLILSDSILLHCRMH